MSATLTSQNTGVVELRKAAAPAEVSFPKRIVTCIAMPYEQPTEIFEGGRVFTEIVSRGAFDGVQNRMSKMPRVNRNHDIDKVVGKIVALHPSRSEGLVTEVLIFNTDPGDETLVLCDQGGLDASAGFTLLQRDDGRIWEDAEEWDRDYSTRRLNKLWLHHLAFVADPAYPGAAITSVRNDSVRPQGTSSRDPKPNLGQVRVDAYLALEADMNRRYSR